MSFDFPKVSREQWEAKIIKDLKGKPYDNLRWKWSEDLVFEPFYVEEDIDKPKGNPLIIGRPGNDWDIAEDFFLGADASLEDIVAMNKMILESLSGGAEALRLYIGKFLSEEEWSALSKDVNFEYISTHFILSGAGVYFIEKIREIFPEESGLRGTVSALGFQTATCLQSIGVDAGKFYGSNDVIPEELANALHEAVSRVCELDDSLREMALDSVYFTLKIGKSYFPSIAKIRALKLLWLRVREGFGVSAKLPQVHVEFSEDAYGEDANTNLIKAATITMSAVIGGADLISVAPCYAGAKPVDAFSRRMGRNVQHLLKMESFLDKVGDPASGAYFVEKLTSVLVEKTWDAFLELEKQA